MRWNIGKPINLGKLRIYWLFTSPSVRDNIYAEGQPAQGMVAGQFFHGNGEVELK